MKPIYVLVKESGDFGHGGSRKIRAYTTPGRANVQRVGFDEIVTYVPLPEGVMTVGIADYEYLLERDRFLDALEQAGVDNWSGYGDAYEIYNEGEDE